ncbi:MAG: ATP-dependent Clp protease adapter ClpS [bacterium]
MAETHRNTPRADVPRDEVPRHGDGAIAERAKPRIQSPPLYKVLLLNDDYTPMEFVVTLLMRFFGLAQDQAEQIMLHIHTKGVGVCGVFPREIAETKVRVTMECAKQSQHPLQCTMERE